MKKARYYSTLERYRNRGLFLGKDQNLMATICVETDMCLLVQSDIDHWFKLQDYLIGNLPDTGYYRLNEES